MVTPPRGFCPRCGQPVAPGEAFCGSCGAPLGAAPFGATATSTGGASGAGTAGGAPTPPRETITGLLLLLLGFALGWIPFADIAGGILILVGLIYLWNGRGELGPVHRKEVKVGVFLLLLGSCVAIAGAVVIIAATLSFTLGFNGTVPTITHPAVSVAEEVAAAVTIAAGDALAIACWVRLPYSLASWATRRWLWLAGGLAVAIGTVYTVDYVLSLVAYSSGVYPGIGSSGPLGDPLLFELLEIAPFGLFFVAYYRIRKALIAGELPRDPRTPSPAP